MNISRVKIVFVPAKIVWKIVNSSLHSKFEQPEK